MKFWFYTIRAMWRTMRGRWFVWRDAPTEVVEHAAEMQSALQPTDTPELKSLVAQAVQELKLRDRHDQT